MPFRPVRSLWTVLEWIVSIANVFEKVYLILVSEQRHSYAMDWCISPALLATTLSLLNKLGM